MEDHSEITVYSGAQIGVDLGGLLAAKECNIPTGGYMPKGFRTEDGPRPHFKKKFGVQEHESSNYQDRTEQNVLESDGTLLIADNFASAGSRLTNRLCEKHNKPCLKIPAFEPDSVEQTVDFIRTNSIRTINVAGNRESVAPGIQKWTKDFMIQVLKELI